MQGELAPGASRGASDEGAASPGTEELRVGKDKEVMLMVVMLVVMLVVVEVSFFKFLFFVSCAVVAVDLHAFSRDCQLASRYSNQVTRFGAYITINPRMVFARHGRLCSPRRNAPCSGERLCVVSIFGLRATCSRFARFVLFVFFSLFPWFGALSHC